MPLTFQTLISSSAGNCLLIRTDSTSLLIDFGFRSQRACQAVLDDHLADPSISIACLTTHTHGDHINYSALKVLERCSIPLYLHESCIAQLEYKHFKNYPFADLKIESFTAKPFTIGDLAIEPIEVPHHPAHLTHGYSITHEDKNILVAADFSKGKTLIPHLKTSDFIYIESNHDLDMLEEFPNFNSDHHMPNPATAELLAQTIPQRKSPPQGVMLGHLSTRRNTAELALEATKAAFEGGDHVVDFDLTAAPPFAPSPMITIA